MDIFSACRKRVPNCGLTGKFLNTKQLKKCQGHSLGDTGDQLSLKRQFQKNILITLLSETQPVKVHNGETKVSTLFNLLQQASLKFMNRNM